MPDPKSETNAPAKGTAKKGRGILLTAWLSLMMLGFILITLSYLAIIVSGSTAAVTALGIPFALIYVLLVLSAAGIVITYFLFNWKKWALYGACVITAISFVINLIYTGLAGSISGVIGLLVLLLLLRNKMNLLE